MKRKGAMAKAGEDERTLKTQFRVQCRISDLPEEMSVMICCFLGLTDLSALSLVDHRFHSITSDSVIWSNLYGRLSREYHGEHIWVGWRPIPLDAGTDQASKKKVKQLVLAHRPPKAHKTKIKDSEESDWRRETWRNVRTLEGHRSRVRHVACAPDGQSVASVAGDAACIIWDLTSVDEPKMKQEIVLKHSQVSCAWSPSGKFLATGGWDKAVAVYSINGDANALHKRLQHPDTVYAVEFLDDNLLLSTGKEMGIIQWDVLAGERLLTRASKQEATCFTVSPENRNIFAAACGGSLRIFDARAQESMLDLSSSEVGVRTCVYSPNGVAIASGCGSQVCLWDTRLPTMPHLIATPNFDEDDEDYPEEPCPALLRCYPDTTQSAGLLGLCFSPDGSIIFAGTDKGDVIRWDTIGGRSLSNMRPDKHTDQVTSVKLSPDGRYIVSGSYDLTVKVWPL